MTVTGLRTDGGPAGDREPRPFGGAFDPEEFRRRNNVSIGMDVLYLVTTAFFAVMFTKGLWPAVIAAVPMAALLYFGWSSSKAFFVAQVLTAAGTLVAAALGLLPL